MLVESMQNSHYTLVLFTLYLNCKGQAIVLMAEEKDIFSKLADFLTKYVYGCYKVFSSKDLTLTGVSSSPRTTEDPGVRLMTRVSSTICAVRNNQGRRKIMQ